jgi:hypothetical protein
MAYKKEGPHTLSVIRAIIPFELAFADFHYLHQLDDEHVVQLLTLTMILKTG